MKYLIKLPPVSDKQLQARLVARKSREDQNIPGSNSKNKTEITAKGPVSIYITMWLHMTIPQFDSLLDLVNIELRKLNIKVSQKVLQSWDSKPRKMLCSVNGGLCIAGVKQLLLHHLKEMEKKLCQHGKRNKLNWYDTPHPELTVSLHGLRVLRLPREEIECKSLSFDSFP